MEAILDELKQYRKNIKKHLYEIEHNFEMLTIYDIFYNFCLNNFINLTTQT